MHALVRSPCGITSSDASVPVFKVDYVPTYLPPPSLTSTQTGPHPFPQQPTLTLGSVGRSH